jgi:hypothetical protein
VPTLTLTVEVPWPKGRTTFSKLERDIHRAAMAAGRKLLVRALHHWEDQLLASAGARQRRVRRYLLTRLGPIRFLRWKTLKDHRYGFPLDRAMRLLPWQTCSAFVWERACRLAKDYPFRQAARLLSDLVGTPVDHRRLWGWLQRAGRTRRAVIDQERSEMFDQGLAPPEAEPVDMVVVEIDGAVLRRQRGGVFEAKVAAAYTGKQEASHTARHRRRYCTGKSVVAGIYPEGVAGPSIYAHLCRSARIHRARHTLVAGDGAEWIPVMVREWFPDSLFQLDHYHLKARLRQAAGRDRVLAGRWISWALGGQWRRIARSMAPLVRSGKLSATVAQDTLAFLELNHSAIWAFKELLTKGAPEELCTRGSGVIEHTIDLLVARRMKRQGMRWSKEGAHNLLALRSLGMDPAAWRTWWKEVMA